MPVRLVAPILVTNSPLRVLKENVGFEDIRSASSLDEITDIHDVVFHYQETGPDLAKSINEVSEYVFTNLDDGKRNVKFDLNYINSGLNYSLETIAIVQLDYLEEYIRHLKNASTSIQVATHEEVYIALKKAGEG